MGAGVDAPVARGDGGGDELVLVLSRLVTCAPSLTQPRIESPAYLKPNSSLSTLGLEASEFTNTRLISSPHLCSLLGAWPMWEGCVEWSGSILHAEPGADDLVCCFCWYCRWWCCWEADAAEAGGLLLGGGRSRTCLVSTLDEETTPGLDLQAESLVLTTGRGEVT